MIKQHGEKGTMSAEEFDNFCRVHGGSDTRLGAFVRTACLMKEAVDILRLQRRAGPGVV